MGAMRHFFISLLIFLDPEKMLKNMIKDQQVFL